MDYRMSAFREVDHHILSNFVSLSVGFAYVSSVPFLLRPRLQKQPMSFRESSSILSNFESIRNTFLCSLVLSKQCRWTLTSIKMILPWKCSGSHFKSEIIVFWISSRILNVANPGKFFHSNSICSRSDPIQKIMCFQKPAKPCFPMIGLVQYWYLPDTALSQKRLRFWHSLKWTALSVNRVVSLT